MASLTVASRGDRKSHRKCFFEEITEKCSHHVDNEGFIELPSEDLEIR